MNTFLRNKSKLELNFSSQIGKESQSSEKIHKILAEKNTVDQIAEIY